MNGEETAVGIGRRLEDAALAWLERRGLRLRGRNYRCRGGEIDLVMEDGDCLVFVEVRYRSDTRYGTPAETIGRRKQQRLLLAARVYLRMHPHRGVARFDVVAIHPERGEPRFEWIRNAFS